MNDPKDDLWTRQFSDAIYKLAWCLAGDDADEPAVKLLQTLAEVVMESNAHKAWQQACHS